MCGVPSALGARRTGRLPKKDSPLRMRLHQGASDPVEVAARYDEWAASYDNDLVSWSYQAPAVVAETAVV